MQNCRYEPELENQSPSASIVMGVVVVAVAVAAVLASLFWPDESDLPADL